jgi:hypothetical protein
MALSTTYFAAESAQLKGSAKDFVAFCETERAHRRNVDPNFDSEIFDEAVRLVLDRLAVFKKEEQE